MTAETINLSLKEQTATFNAEISFGKPIPPRWTEMRKNGIPNESISEIATGFDLMLRHAVLDTLFITSADYQARALIHIAMCRADGGFGVLATYDFLNSFYGTNTGGFGTTRLLNQLREEVKCYINSNGYSYRKLAEHPKLASSLNVERVHRAQNPTMALISQSMEVQMLGDVLQMQFNIDSRMHSADIFYLCGISVDKFVDTTANKQSTVSHLETLLAPQNRRGTANLMKLHLNTIVTLGQVTGEFVPVRIDTLQTDEVANANADVRTKPVLPPAELISEINDAS